MFTENKSPREKNLGLIRLGFFIRVLFPVNTLLSLTSDREVPGSIPTGSRSFCAVTRGTGYSWPGMRVKCILYTVGYIILGRNARLYFDVKLKYLYLFTFFYSELSMYSISTHTVQTYTRHRSAVCDALYRVCINKRRLNSEQARKSYDTGGKPARNHETNLNWDYLCV